MTNTETYNLSAYFMLPLLGLSTKNFGGSNMENVYITTQMQVVVRVKKIEDCKGYSEAPSYMLDYIDDDGMNNIVYALGEEWSDDFIYYTKGMYSKMSMFAKDQIRKNSGLVYHKPAGKQPTFDKDGRSLGTQQLYETHAFLRALDKEEVLRSYIETELDVTIHPEAELLSKIGDNEYIKL